MGLSSSVHPGLERSAQTHGAHHSHQRPALRSGHVSCMQGLVEEDWKEVLVANLSEMLHKYSLFPLKDSSSGIVQ